jgi:tellurite resistance protein
MKKKRWQLIELKRAKLTRVESGGREARNQMLTEIKEVADKDATGEMGKTILLIALDVADQGGLDPKEETVLRRIASVLGANYDEVAGI